LQCHARRDVHPQNTIREGKTKKALSSTINKTPETSVENASW
jgi:hypothetical protein